LPARKESLNRRGIERIADALEGVGLGAGEKAVVQRREADAARLQLPLRPFMTIETDLDCTGGA